jgi:hypothetical protein
MTKSIKIEVESNSEKDLHKLLEHVFYEITEGMSYSNIDVEINSKVDDNNWLIVDGKDISGRYYWKRR